MKRFVLIGALAASALTATPSYAAVTPSLGNGGGSFLTLNSTGLNGGAVATLSGGQVLNSDQPFADIPAGGVFGSAFLAAGPTVGHPATLNFTAPVAYLSFLWGSPDLYNVLTITTLSGTQSFTAASLGFSVTNGDQSFSQYVQFAGVAGDLITKVSFDNSPSTDAFETANFSITRAVPEPATWAMMLLGFGAIGMASRRRRTQLLPQVA